MTENEQTKSTEQEMLQKRNKTKSDSIINALFIGVMIGIVVYSIAKNSIGLVTLIPLFFIYKALTNSKKK